MMLRRLPAAATAFLLILLALAGIAPAQERDWNRFRISLGTFIVDFDTTVRVDSPSGRTPINLEDDLGLDSDHTETVISARYRFARRHSIGLGYLNFDRASRRLLEQDVPFGDDLFTVGLNVETSFEFDLLNFDYRYALIQKPNFDFSFSIGINMERATMVMMLPVAFMPRQRACHGIAPPVAPRISSILPGRILPDDV